LLKVLTLPILSPLREVLDASEVGEATYLLNANGQTWASGDAFGNWFCDCCREAGLPLCSPHGLRKIGAVRAAETGASEHELMAMFGWENADMARVYTRKAAQKKLAASGAAKLIFKKAIVPPEKIYNKNNILNGRWCPEEDSNLHGLHH
jgi:integrase